MLVAKGGLGVVYRLLDRELNAKRLATWAPGPLHVVVLQKCNTRYSTRAARPLHVVGMAWIYILHMAPGKLSTGYPQISKNKLLFILYKIKLW